MWVGGRHTLLGLGLLRCSGLLLGGIRPGRLSGLLLLLLLLLLC